MINTVESLNSGILVLQLDSQNTSVADQIKTLCNPFIKAPSTIIKTEHGYTVIIPPQNIGGPQIEVEKLGNGYYLVQKTPPYYGAKTETILMSEKEFIREFNGFKTKKEVDEKIDVKKLVDKSPYDYFRTKGGYIIRFLNGNNITGASTEIKPQADGTYLVLTKAYAGAPAEKKYFTEQELVTKFHGEKAEVPDKIYHLVA